jgi:hypothetical protein
LKSVRDQSWTFFLSNFLGRNTEELVRMVTTLEKTRQDKVLTPANWRAGEDVMIPAIPKAASTNEELVSEGIYNLTWFMWYKKASQKQ